MRNGVGTVEHADPNSSFLGFVLQLDVRTDITLMGRRTQKLKYMTPQVTTPDSGIPRKTREAISPPAFVQAAIVMMMMAPRILVMSAKRLEETHK